jgi:hypothetical protein
MQEYSKNYRNKDGSWKSYNPGQLYIETPKYVDEFQKAFGNLNAISIENGRTYFIDSQGIKRDTTNLNEDITREMIKGRAVEALPAFRNTDSYKSYLRKAVKVYGAKTMEEAYKFADAESVQGMVSANLDQLTYKRKNIIKDNTLSVDWLARFSNPTEGQWLDYTNLNQEMFNDKLTDLKTNFNYSILSETIPNTIPGLKLGAKIFEIGLNNFNKNDFIDYSNLKSPQKNLLNLFMENNKNEFFVTSDSDASRKYKANEVFENYKNGKATLEEKALIQDYFSDFLNKELSPNLSKNTKVKGLDLKQQKQIGTNLGITLGDRGEFDIKQAIESGPLKNVEVYDQQKNKFVKFSDIKFGSDDKAIINLEFSHNSPFFFMSGNKPEFANPRQLSVKDKDGNIKNFVIPKLEGSANEKYTDEVVGKISLADNLPGKIVPSHKPGFNVKLTTKDFVQPNPSMTEGLTYNTGMENTMLQTGLDLPKSYDVYDKQGRKLNTMILSTPIEAAAFIDNYNKK